MDVNGNVYTMRCSSDTTIGCVAFAYVGGENGRGGGTCWMKNQVGSPTSAGTNSLIGVLKAAAPTSTIAAVPTAPVQEDYSCPENDRQRVIDNYGGVYTLACSSDTSGGGAFAGDSPDFNGCFEKCDSTVNCVGFTYDGNNCYLKTGAANSISFVPAASNFVGAIRNVPSDGNLYSVTPSSTPPQTTTVYGTQTQFNTLTQTQTAHPSARDFVFDHNINCHLDCSAASSEHEHHNYDIHELCSNTVSSHSRLHNHFDDLCCNTLAADLDCLCSDTLATDFDCLCGNTLAIHLDSLCSYSISLNSDHDLHSLCCNTISSHSHLNDHFDDFRLCSHPSSLNLNSDYHNSELVHSDTDDYCSSTASQRCNCDEHNLWPNSSTNSFNSDLDYHKYYNSSGHCDIDTADCDDHCARTSCQYCNNYCTSTSSKYCDGYGDTILYYERDSCKSSSARSNYWLPNNDTSAAPTVALSSPTTIISSAANHDDEIVARVVPFAISICGFSSNNLTISTNGVLGFGITSSYQPAALPQYTALSPPGYAVIPFWADLYIAQGTSQGIYYQVDGTAGSRIMTFEYYATYYNKTANYYHFQILFYENNPNSFTFKYLNVTDNGVNAVVGYQCQPNSKFKQYSAKQAIITGGLQVDYSYSADTFTSGRVPSRVAMIGPMIDFVNRIVDNVSSSWRAATSWMRDKPSSTPSNEVYAPKPSVTFEANFEDSINRRWAGGYGRRENSSTLA
ncbi:hypothetical protein D6C89_06396 [Aureobasidium pullulans]|nr:hypothetical protein D6C89_06396 [Aureobasidium pullulans]